MTNRELFVQIWEREQSKYLRVMEALPADRLDYRPHPKSRSAVEMVTLLAREQETLVGMMDRARVDWKETVAEDFNQMIDLWKKSTDELRDRLKKLDDAGWKWPVKFFLGGKEINEVPTDDLLWGFLLDMVHHRGQLSTYIRPMGGKVPSIYGPSADVGPA